MPPRRGSVGFGLWFYKDAAPTALRFAQLPPPSAQKHPLALSRTISLPRDLRSAGRHRGHRRRAARRPPRPLLAETS